MKKLLLSLVALLATVGAWAQPAASDSPVNGKWAPNTTWFTVGTVNDFYLINSGTHLSNKASNGDNGRWCVVGDAENGYYFYNKGTGTDKVLAMSITNPAPSMQAPGAEGYTTKFYIRESQKLGAWCITEGKDNNVCFDCGSGSNLGYWNSTSAFNNNSSAFYFLTIEFAESAEDITKWYYLRLNKNQSRYVYADGSVLTRAEASNIDKDALDNYLWGFVGKYGEVQIINKANKANGIHFNLNAEGKRDGAPSVDIPSNFKIERNKNHTTSDEMFFLKSKSNGNDNCLNGGIDLPVAFWSQDPGSVLIPEEYKEYSAEINNTVDYATLILDYQAYIPAEVEAYIVSGASGNYATLQKVEGILPANTGVILKNAGSHVFKLAKGTASDVTGNKLAGSVVDDYIEGPAYVLANKNGVGFYRAELNKNEAGADGETHFLNNANKAYLPASAVTASARFLSFDFGTETAIESVEAETATDAVAYDLAGRRVKAAQKGLYIVNGKVVIK